MDWLIGITGLPYDVLVLMLLCVAGAFAGFVDSIGGGGGLISVAAMLLTNLPPSVALGSNKLSSIFGAGSASITFLRNGMVDFSLVRKLLPFTFIGSMGGTVAVVSLPPLYVKPIIIALLVGVTLFVVFKRNWGEVCMMALSDRGPEHFSSWVLFLRALIFFTLRRMRRF